MAAIPDEIAKLSNADLRRELLRVGITPTPLTPTTRRIYQKKLAQRLCNAELSIDQTSVQIQDLSINKATEPLQQTNKIEDGEKQHQAGGDEKSLQNLSSYFAVLIPTEDNKVSSKILRNKNDVMKLLQHQKDSRYKQVESHEEAQKFINSHSFLPERVKAKSEASEKANDFPAPKQVELTRLMRSIESNDLAAFEEMVWKNPRFLISAADGPVPLKPSVRYNALHVASRANQANMVRNILETLQDPKFLDLMYSNCAEQSEKSRRTEHIVDLYLNTPEKGCFETPLHLACKFGYVDVVAELTSSPLCDKTLKNKDGLSPAEVVCSRCKEGKDLRAEILYVIGDHYYVPLYRYQNNTLPPVVGKPWVPSESLEGASEPLEDFRAAPRAISAIAGPMSREEAQDLYNRWSTLRRKDRQARHYIDIRLRDLERGEERVGRMISHDKGHQWCEYWDFLETFTDLAKEEGLLLLEDYLRHKNNAGCSSLPSKSYSLGDLSLQMSLMKLASPISKCDDIPTPTGSGSDKAASDARSCPASTLIKHHLSDAASRKELLKSTIQRRHLSRALRFSSPDGPGRRLTLSLPTPSPLQSNHRTQISCNSTSMDSSSSTFLSGNLPSKLDHDVLIAICGKDVDLEKYPHISVWADSVRAYPENERARWKTPRKFESTNSQSVLWPSSPLSHRSAAVRRKELFWDESSRS